MQNNSCRSCSIVNVSADFGLHRNDSTEYFRSKDKTFIFGIMIPKDYLSLSYQRPLSDDNIETVFVKFSVK